MTTTLEPTARQRQIHRYMLEYQREHGYPPTVREVGIRFEIRSPNGVACTLKALARKGWVRRPARSISRGWVAIDLDGGACPTCGRPTDEPRRGDHDAD